MGNMAKPPLAAHVYRVAASAGLGDREVSRKYTDALRAAYPDFDPDRFVETIPYEHEREKNDLLGALRGAGL